MTVTVAFITRKEGESAVCNLTAASEIQAS